MVGLSGLVVNTLLLALWTDIVGMYYMFGLLLATQGSSLWNFLLSELSSSAPSTAAKGRSAEPRVPDHEQLALLARGPIVYCLTRIIGANYLLQRDLNGRTADPAVCAGRLLDLEPTTRGEIAGLSLAPVNYPAPTAACTRERPLMKTTHAYDIHGILTVSSDVALPELRPSGSRPPSGADHPGPARRRPGTAQGAIERGPEGRHPLESTGQRGFAVHVRLEPAPRSPPRRSCVTPRMSCTPTLSSRSCGGRSSSEATRSCMARAWRSTTGHS